MNEDEEQGFQIWSEGYACTGECSDATYHGEQRGKTFKDACIKFFFDTDLFDPKRMTYWGCKLFETEVKARKSFG